MSLHLMCIYLLRKKRSRKFHLITNFSCQPFLSFPSRLFLLFSYSSHTLNTDCVKIVCELLSFLVCPSFVVASLIILVLIVSALNLLARSEKRIKAHFSVFKRIFLPVSCLNFFLCTINNPMSSLSFSAQIPESVSSLQKAH